MFSVGPNQPLIRRIENVVMAAICHARLQRSHGITHQTEQGDTGLSCQTQDSANNEDTLLSLCLPRLSQCGCPGVLIPSQYHIKTLTVPVQAPELRWQLPFYLIKKTFYKFPWKLENSNCLDTDRLSGRGESYQKLILKLASNRSRLWAETPGGIILFMKSGDSERVGARVPSWDLRAGLITCH